MRKHEVEKYRDRYQNNPRSFWVFGEDLVDSGSPNPCSRSAAARQVLHGRWEKAFKMWLDDGEFSRDTEELYVGWMLAAEVIVNKKAIPAQVPDLPRRIWSEAEYIKSVRHFEDLKYRNQVIAGLLEPGKTEWRRQRVAIGTLIQQNRPEDAERLYHEYEWRENDFAESNLALIHSCARAVPETENQTALWYYHEAGRGSGGPIRYEKLKALFLEVRLTDRCLVWRPGMKEWVWATSLATFKSVLYSGQRPPPLPSKI